MAGGQAIEGKRQSYFMVDLERLTVITDIHHGLFDERALLPPDEDLAANIAAIGVQEPILIRKKDGRLEVVDGRRRCAALGRANEMRAEQGASPFKMPVIKKDGDSRTLYPILISVNEHRLDDTPLARAKKWAHMSNTGATDEDGKIAFGVTRQTLRNWERLLECGPDVQKAVAERGLSAAAARELADLDRSEQKAKLAELLADGAKPNVADTKRAVRKTSTKPAARRAKPKASEVRKVLGWLRERPGDVREAHPITILEWLTGEVDSDASVLRLHWLADALASVRGEKTTTEA